MLKRCLPWFVLAFVVVACNKDFNTRPSISIRNINATEIPPGAQLIITLEYTDKEGDLGGGIITYVRNRLNVRPIPDAASNDKTDTVERLLPDFPKTASGDIEIKIDNQFMSEDPFDNDTMVFKFYVKDVEGNVSDTISTGTVIDRQL